jgi:hypothetical protein
MSNQFNQAIKPSKVANYVINLEFIILPKHDTKAFSTEISIANSLVMLVDCNIIDLYCCCVM